MEQTRADVGLVGLAVMGQNLALNIAEKGFPISVFNRSPDKVDLTVKRAADEGGLPLKGYKDIAEFVMSVKRPRRVIILVKAGSAVDAIIDQLLKLMEPGDLIVDGGNEWYENTEKREQVCKPKGVLYMGMGVSGGEEGARNGPSLMPGGSPESYALMEPIVKKIAAQVSDGPCVTHIGPGGSGNYVKMVHNGIEYGDMQLIAEAYHLLKKLAGQGNGDLAETFAQWNAGELQSFLIEITAEIFKKRDDLNTEGELIDAVRDVAKSKGTGKWTIQEAAERGVPVPTMAAAVDMRNGSGLLKVREVAKEAYSTSNVMSGLSPVGIVGDVQAALYCSKICSYAQGLMLIQKTSEEKGWNIDLAEISRIWKGGCIIRAGFLSRISEAYRRNGDLPNLLLDESFQKEIHTRIGGWRRIIQLAQHNGIAIPALSSSLGYFDMLRAPTLPTNLVQAQRDYFGAHTYERTDREGPFHSRWGE